MATKIGIATVSCIIGIILMAIIWATNTQPTDVCDIYCGGDKGRWDETAQLCRCSYTDPSDIFTSYPINVKDVKKVRE
jgi:hypothetical protein